METKHFIAAGALCAMMAACSHEDDLHWLPQEGYVKPANEAGTDPAAPGTTPETPKPIVTSVADLCGPYHEVTMIDGTTQTGTATMTAKGGSNNVLLLTGFMGHPEPLDIRIDMEANKVYIESESWYSNTITILSCPLTAELYAVGTFDEHGVITINAWNIYDISTLLPLYTTCTTTLTRQW